MARWQPALPVGSACRAEPGRARNVAPSKGSSRQEEPTSSILPLPPPVAYTSLQPALPAELKRPACQIIAVRPNPPAGQSVGSVSVLSSDEDAQPLHVSRLTRGMESQ